MSKHRRFTLHRLSGEVGSYGRSVADCEGLDAERVGGSCAQVSGLQPALPAAPHVHRHHFTHPCSHWRFGFQSFESPVSAGCVAV